VEESQVTKLTIQSNNLTTAAVDNIDHNPSSTTAKSSFHGTCISLTQHPSFMGEGVDRTIVVSGGSGHASTFIRQLPQYYTDVPRVTSSVKNVPVPAVRVTSLDREAKQHTAEEYLWQHNARQVLDGNAEGCENIFPCQPPATRSSTHLPHALHSMFEDSAHTVAMICHCREDSSTHLPHRPASRVPGPCPHSGHDLPLS